ncbi:thioredoxin family protein [Niastella caeni]|nr:thioredoxin family protein [Niastella caeni]
MRLLFLFLAPFLNPVYSYAQSRSINFEHGSISQALSKADSANKLVFIDCYTVWCGPCKAMAAHVFTQDSVADFFNSQFINVKMDMEKGEGISMKDKYHVEAYPTYLLLNGAGKLMYRFVGGMTSDSFMAKIRKGMNPSNKVAIINERYDAGERSKELLREYIQIKMDGREVSVGIKMCNEYFDMLTPEERILPENWFLFGENKYSMYLSELHSRTFNYLADHWRDFAKVQGKAVVESKLRHMYLKIAGYTLRGWYFKNAHNEVFPYSKKEFDNYRRQIGRTELEDKKQLITLIMIAQAAGEKDTVRVSALLAKNIGGFSAENQRIGFDYISMIRNPRSTTIPHYQEVLDAIIQSNKNQNLVRTARSYKK